MGLRPARWWALDPLGRLPSAVCLRGISRLWSVLSRLCCCCGCASRVLLDFSIASFVEKVLHLLAVFGDFWGFCLRELEVFWEVEGKGGGEGGCVVFWF